MFSLGIHRNTRDRVLGHTHINKAFDTIIPVIIKKLREPREIDINLVHVCVMQIVK